MGQRQQIAQAAAVDLRVGADPQPQRLRLRHRGECPREAPRTPHRVVGLLQSVDRVSDLLQARLRERRETSGRESPGARGHARPHPVLPRSPDHIGQVGPQIRLAANEGDLSDAQLRELIDQGQRLLRRQLVAASLARSRTTRDASLVTGKRELPHRIRRSGPLPNVRGAKGPALRKLADDRQVLRRPRSIHASKIARGRALEFCAPPDPQ